MTDRGDREQQQAELLWKYLEELKQADQPEEVQFVAVTSGECTEVVGLMETAAEACAVVRADSAPHCRREAVRQRLRSAIANAPPPAAREAVGITDPVIVSGLGRWREWLAAPLTGRSTGWAVAVAALVALLWFMAARPQSEARPATVVTAASHSEAVEALPSLVEGRLDAERTAAVWAHLNQCEGCFRSYEEKWRLAHPGSRPGQQSYVVRPYALSAECRSQPAGGWVAPDRNGEPVEPAPRLVPWLPAGSAQRPSAGIDKRAVLWHDGLE